MCGKRQLHHQIFDGLSRDADTRARSALLMALGTSFASSTIILEIPACFPPRLAGCVNRHCACSESREHRTTTVQLPQV